MKSKEECVGEISSVLIVRDFGKSRLTKLFPIQHSFIALKTQY